VPLLALGAFLALLGFVGLGGARSPAVGWVSLVWLGLGLAGLVLVRRAPRRP
jgi:hypothetical protein